MTRENIEKILYKNSTDTGMGMLIDFSDIHKVIDLLVEDKVLFAKEHVEAALNAAGRVANEWENSGELRPEILDSYNLENIK